MHIDVQTCQRGIPEYNMISSLLKERWNQYNHWEKIWKKAIMKIGKKTKMNGHFKEKEWMIK